MHNKQSSTLAKRVSFLWRVKSWPSSRGSCLISTLDLICSTGILACGSALYLRSNCAISQAPVLGCTVSSFQAWMSRRKSCQTDITPRTFARSLGSAPRSRSSLTISLKKPVSLDRRENPGSGKVGYRAKSNKGRPGLWSCCGEVSNVSRTYSTRLFATAYARKLLLLLDTVLRWNVDVATCLLPAMLAVQC